jgi:hypothetical protein
MVTTSLRLQSSVSQQPWFTRWKHAALPQREELLRQVPNAEVVLAVLIRLTMALVMTLG